MKRKGLEILYSKWQAICSYPSFTFSLLTYTKTQQLVNVDFILWQKLVSLSLEQRVKNKLFIKFNPWNAELNPICHLLALLGAHHILHINRIRVK
jgi:hypothetical protein